ncbi:unnamed protein product [Oncorhynchus mykiss]|uniref:Uncharacterized protein n=1 Tax=Oncorhynchus mykiss TaxID=8022 RepID=A0A060VTN4_ONCMY|nr:unnamed protein product [Oncorhynchus mykiss]
MVANGSRVCDNTLCKTALQVCVCVCVCVCARGRNSEKKRSVHLTHIRRWIFLEESRAMLEHSSELALVQSIYVNGMRCPPSASAAGVPVRNEDLGSLRYVVLGCWVGPSFRMNESDLAWLAFVVVGVGALASVYNDYLSLWW